MTNLPVLAAAITVAVGAAASDPARRSYRRRAGSVAKLIHVIDPVFADRPVGAA